MDPSMQQQQHQYYYAPGAPTGAMPPGYYAAPLPAQQQNGSGDSNGYVLPMQHAQPQQMMYYAPAPPPPGCAPATYAYAAPMYYQPPEAAFAAMSLSGQTLLPMQAQLQPQQTPGASSTTSNGSQPRASSTPIPSDEQPASLNAQPACNPAMIPMHVMYAQMPQPQYYQMALAGYGEAAGAPQMMTMMYQDPATGQYGQYMAPMQQQQHQMTAQQAHHMNRMMSTDPDAIPENIDDISQISHQSSPESFMDHTLGLAQRHPTTPVSSTMRRRISLPPSNQQNGHHSIPNLLPSNYKTRMCTQWLEKRYGGPDALECSMAGACKFAHGNAELRLPERPFRAINNPKYKTKMCKNFEPGASGLCAYAERCEYIHPTDREYAMYKGRIEALARSRGDFGRYKAMFDEVPGVPRRGRGGASSIAGGDEENKSVRSSADSSCGNDASGEGSSGPLTQRAGRERRGSTRDSGYLGSAMPPSITRSAIRMGAGGDIAHASREQPMRRGFAGGSMYNLASGTYTDRDEYRDRARLARVPSATNVASLGLGGGGGGGNYRNPARYGAAPAKFNRRASMCHLNTAADY